MSSWPGCWVVAVRRTCLVGVVRFVGVVSRCGSYGLSAQSSMRFMRSSSSTAGPARPSDAHTDLGPRPGNGPPPAPHPRHRRGGVLRSPPQPLGERNQRKHQPAHPPLPAQRNPITSHQPYLDAIAYELNNCPRATLGYRTPTEAFNELIATTH